MFLNLERTKHVEVSTQPVFGARQTAKPPISLQFGADVSPFMRPRISYAFRVFAAIYGYKVVESDENAEFHCVYGTTPANLRSPRTFQIPSLYRDVRFQNGWKRSLIPHRYAGEEFQLAFGIDATSGKPDWLGELFLWLSGAYELDILKRDRIGRIPYSEMVFARCGVSPLKPYASMLMAWMQNALRHGNSREELPRSPSPSPGKEHLVVSSHDIDFYFVDRTSTLLRIIKNLGLAMKSRCCSFFSDNLKMLFQLVRGNRVGDYLPALLEAGEKYDFCSTLFVVPRRGHRRDPNYSLGQVLPLLLDAAKKGFPAGVHGSYRSIIEDRTLRAEAQTLRRNTGTTPLAGRQHWLRFGELQYFLAEISRAGLACDSTLGFSEMAGFRNGASFAFPPYDFENAKPHQFLEIPLVLMDGGLHAASRSLRRNPQELADEVLAQSRKYGWGGISILWHDPIEPLAVPSEINDVFWNCAKKKQDFREEWVSADQFLVSCLQRYQQAGLLEGVRVDG